MYDIPFRNEVFKEHVVQEYSADFLNDKNVGILLVLGKTNMEEVLLNNPELRNSKQVFRVK